MSYVMRWVGASEGMEYGETRQVKEKSQRFWIGWRFRIK